MNMNERLRRNMEQKGKQAAKEREIQRKLNEANFNAAEYEKAEKEVAEFHRKRRG